MPVKMKPNKLSLFPALIIIHAMVHASGEREFGAVNSDTNRIEVSPLFFGPPTPEYPFEEGMTVEKLAIWEYQTHLDPDSKAPGAKELNAAYRKWLASTK